MFTRRHFIKAAGAGLALTGSGPELGSARNYETPIEYDPKRTKAGFQSCSAAGSCVLSLVAAQERSAAPC